ncbi:TetR/AcrR family transcriptional regulator [Nonomuraea deserti]|uniref:TetR/AcrR family transcriptional regulator n=2 Tax=Nonomuraea deserti TaxID=1848322 RepID=A0A4R4VUC7_9ACTN|nr:TetR/AcrR family transcriptional regulator [Nonomuraea deserti]
MQSRSPAKRADAERNRGKILAVARAAFAGSEPHISMAEISRRAGVGMATFYRNFASRRALLETLWTDEINAVCEAAETASGETPGAAFTAWLRQFFAFSTSKHHIAAELLADAADAADTAGTAGTANGDRIDPVIGRNRARVRAAGQPLLAAARRTHEVRHDLTLEQILDMIVAIATINGDQPYLEPIFQTALDGLRPPAADAKPS